MTRKLGLTSRADIVYRVLQVLLLVLAAAILIFAYRTGASLTYIDEKQYLEIASGIARGDGFELAGLPTAYRPPTWPLILAPAVALKLPLCIISLIPAVCLILAAWAAGGLGVRISGTRFGIAAGLAVLAYPLDIYAAGTLYPQALATALLLGVWFVVSKNEDRERSSISAREALTLGLLCAAMTLAVPTLALTAVIILGWLFFRQSGNRLGYGIAAGIGFGAPILGWTLRNVFTMHSATALSTSSGVNLLLGNSENTTPTNGLSADISHYRDAANQLGLNELQRNKYFSDQAFDWITAHPADAAILYLGKLANYFSPYNQPATSGQGGLTQAIISWVAMSVVVILCFGRYYLSRRSSLPMMATEKLFAAIFFLNAPVMAIYFTRVRFRQPLDAILLVEAGIFVAFIVSGCIVRRAKHAGKLAEHQ